MRSRVIKAIVSDLLARGIAQIKPDYRAMHGDAEIILKRRLTYEEIEEIETEFDRTKLVRSRNTLFAKFMREHQIRQERRKKKASQTPRKVRPS